MLVRIEDPSDGKSSPAAGLAVAQQPNHHSGVKLLVLSTTILLSIHSISPAGKPAVIAQVKLEQAEKYLASGAQLLDVRTQEEWDEGHLKGATLVIVTEDGFLEKAKAALDPKKEVLVYCRSGKRSATAAKQLRSAGFTVYDLEGGIIVWKAAGKPVVK
jgi:rhodanese-related sulfurtransferase